MNVLFLAEELRVGGAETYFYSLENNINRNDFNFYCMAVDGEQKSKLLYPQNYYSYSFSVLDRYKKVVDICKLKKIDVIHVNSLRLAFVAAAVKKIIKKLRVIYTRHNITALEKKSKKIYSRFLNKNIDCINAICYAEKKYLISIGVNENKIKVIYNGINTDKFEYLPRQNKDKKIYIGILARVDKVKNHRLFLQIAKLIHNQYPETYFYIGGDGPDFDNIKQIIVDFDMSAYVEMCGYVNAKEFLPKLDFIYLVSEREVFPISLIEAMATGVIVISKNLGGIKELTDGTGYLVDGDNPKDYLIAFENAIECETLEQKRILARKKAEDLFSIKNMVSQIENMYLGKE